MTIALAVVLVHLFLQRLSTYFDDKTGQIKAKYLNLTDKSSWSNADQVCPFSSASENEDVLAKRYYSSLQNYDKRIGYYKSIFVSRVVNPSIYSKSSSGGLIRWILNPHSEWQCQ